MTDHKLIVTPFVAMPKETMIWSYKMWISLFLCCCHPPIQGEEQSPWCSWGGRLSLSQGAYLCRSPPFLALLGGGGGREAGFLIWSQERYCINFYFHKARSALNLFLSSPKGISSLLQRERGRKRERKRETLICYLHMHPNQGWNLQAFGLREQRSNRRSHTG